MKECTKKMAVTLDIFIQHWKKKLCFFFHVQKKCEKKEITIFIVNKIYIIYIMEVEFGLRVWLEEVGCLEILPDYCVQNYLHHNLHTHRTVTITSVYVIETSGHFNNA